MQAKLLEKLEVRRRRDGASQEAWAARLQVSQGHYSKIVRGITPISHKVQARVEALLEIGGPQSDIEERLLNAYRTSSEFRILVSAALKMHEKA